MSEAVAVAVAVTVTVTVNRDRVDRACNTNFVLFCRDTACRARE